MNDYKTYLDEQLKDEDFAAEWERQAPEREYLKAIISARMESNLILPRGKVRHHALRENANRKAETPNTQAVAK